MTYADLRKYRMRAPFVIAAACAVPYFVIRAPQLSAAQLANQLLVPIIALVTAGIYVGLDMRSLLWSHETHGVMGNQIRKSLLELIPADLNLTETERETLASQDVFKELSGIFWEAIDRDPQLTQQKQFFYSNGAIYTTVIDAILLCTIAALLYVIEWLISGEYEFLLVTAILISVAAVGRLLALPRVRSRHLTLSTQQLELLRRQQKDFIETRFRAVVLRRRGTAPSKEA